MAEQKHTEFAMKALGLADLFGMVVGKEPLGGAIRYRVELSAPDGMSTGGGAQSVQHIKLVPEGGGATIVAGSANQVDKSSELRTFAHLAELHAQRFRGADLPLDRAAYDALAQQIQAFFSQQGFRFVLVEAARPPGRPTGALAPVAQKGTSWLGGAVLGVVGLLLAVAIYLFRHGHHP